MNKSTGILAVCGAAVGGFIGWSTKPGPSFSTFASANPEQAYMGEVTLHVLMWAAGAAAICALLGFLMSKGSKDA
ncbi:hypothetical protein [Salaquimonas pukyongi]|uniref:hypothetical protein n=1 Tax=Salaquimonas pukyongi TaxID=2712698 RepID=UPI00096B721A|nr:hypothetical protein [Salaquimonas pukyongi]